jgi:hypothetical protein
MDNTNKSPYSIGSLSFNLPPEWHAANQGGARFMFGPQIEGFSPNIVFVEQPAEGKSITDWEKQSEQELVNQFHEGIKILSRKPDIKFQGKPASARMYDLSQDDKVVRQIQIVVISDDRAVVITCSQHPKRFDDMVPTFDQALDFSLADQFNIIKKPGSESAPKAKIDSTAYEFSVPHGWVPSTGKGEVVAEFVPRESKDVPSEELKSRILLMRLDAVAAPSDDALKSLLQVFFSTMISEVRKKFIEQEINIPDVIKPSPSAPLKLANRDAFVSNAKIQMKMKHGGFSIQADMLTEIIGIRTTSDLFLVFGLSLNEDAAELRQAIETIADSVHAHGEPVTKNKESEVKKDEKVVEHAPFRLKLNSRWKVAVNEADQFSATGPLTNNMPAMLSINHTDTSVATNDPLNMVEAILSSLKTSFGSDHVQVVQAPSELSVGRMKAAAFVIETDYMGMGKQHQLQMVIQAPTEQIMVVATDQPNNFAQTLEDVSYMFGIKAREIGAQGPTTSQTTPDKQDQSDSVDLVARMIDTMYRCKSFSCDGTYSINLIFPDTKEEINLHLAFTGSDDRSDTSNEREKANLVINLTGSVMGIMLNSSANLDLIYVEKDLYIRVNQLQLPLILGGYQERSTKHLNTWFKLPKPMDSVKNAAKQKSKQHDIAQAFFGDDEVTPEMRKPVVDYMVKNLCSVFDVTQTAAHTKELGKPATRLILKLNKERAMNYIVDLGKMTESEIPADMQKKISWFIDNLGLTLTLVIGRKDGYLYHGEFVITPIQGSDIVQDEKVQSTLGPFSKATYQMDGSLHIKGFNQPLRIQAPADAKTFNEAEFKSTFDSKSPDKDRGAPESPTIDSDIPEPEMPLDTNSPKKGPPPSKPKKPLKRKLPPNK